MSDFLAKEEVEGSNPLFRSNRLAALPEPPLLSEC